MAYGTNKSCLCLICDEQFDHMKKLSEHIKKIHNLSPQEYYTKYFNNNLRPSCLICGGETRYVSLSEGFKKYCASDAKVAASMLGSAGGKIKKTWNKGKTKEDDARILEQSKKMSGEGNPFYGKKHLPESIKRNADAHRLKFDEVIGRVSREVSSVSVVSGWKSYESQNSLLRVACKKCLLEDDVSFFNLMRCWRCKNCDPIGSRQQLDISNYVKSFGFIVEDSTKKVIPPLELDVWIPEKMVAIEYHGLYWHSGGRESTFDKRRHRKKYEACAAAGIKLIQIFSDEWRDKEDICKSIIKNALGKNDVKLNARDCVVEDVDVTTAQKFLNDTHISGYTRCKHKFGLFHKTHGLVGIATTRTPIQGRWGRLSELARMSFASGVSVRGGASKLLEKVKSQAVVEGFEGVLSYADLRFGNGAVYEKCGLKYIGESTINYWYTDGHKRFDRFAFKAQPGKSEKLVADEAGVRAVWGSGNKIYAWKHDPSIFL